MELKTFFTPEELKADLAFSDADLHTAMMKQAPLFAHYASIAARAQKQADDMKMILEITEGKVDKDLRNQAAAAGEKITEASLSKALVRSSKYVEALRRYNDARMIADLARNALEAFKQRRDMLVQIGVTQREEMKGDLLIKARERTLDEKKAGVLGKVSA